MPARARATSRQRRGKGGLAALKKRLDAVPPGGYRVKVGLPKGAANYPDGTSVHMVGAVHEFGSSDGRIPERSWLLSTVRIKSRDHRAATRKLAESVSRGGRSPDQALELLGTIVAADVRERIVEVDSPPNAPSTIAAKGSSNPLIDTGHMRQQVTYQVVKGKR